MPSTLTNPAEPVVKKPPEPAPASSAVCFRRFLLFAGLLVVCFALPFYDLLCFAREKDLFSHLPLIPFICGYLVWIQRARLAASPVGGCRWPGAALAALGLALLLLPWVAGAGVSADSAQNRLCALIFSFCLLLWAGGFILLGGRFMREVAFPAIFLVFLVPFPPLLVRAIEHFLQYASADVAYLFIQWAGIPVLRDGLDGLTFILPAPASPLTVAPECSGIRSSLVLFITALLAGHLFLRAGWKRAFLALLVIPLGIARNGFRILVISLLTVHVDPSYIDSPIHHRGGPIFFVVSLVPFTLILLWLIRSERRPPP